MEWLKFATIALWLISFLYALSQPYVTKFQYFLCWFCMMVFLIKDFIG